MLTRFSFFQKRFGCNFKGSLSEIPTVLGVWIFSGTTHCVNILRNITPQYTRFPLYNINFSYILLYRQSSILQGIYFLIHVYDYTKIKGLDLGNYIIAKQPKRADQLGVSFWSFWSRLICI